MAKNLKYSIPYDIGIDIGDGSVGYAVIDKNRNMLKFKSKNMWGVDLFDAGQSAQDTRLKRGMRRRYNRRRNRIDLLQSLLSDDVLKADESFFIRLKESSLHKEDRSGKYKFNLFHDSSFSDKDYFKNYPTIYHLRKDLLYSKEKKDIRLVYLAIHNIIKYRGNFIYEGQNFDINADSTPKLTSSLIDAVTNTWNVEINDTAFVSHEITDILSNREIKKADKKKLLINVFSNLVDKKISTQLATAILGYKTNFNEMFATEFDDAKFSFTEEDADIRFDGMLDDNQFGVYYSLYSIYSTLLLGEILSGENGRSASISEAKIYAYDKHHKDLKILKKLMREYFEDDYNLFFNQQYLISKSEKKTTDDKYKNYANYIRGESYCSNEELLVAIKKILEKKPELKDVTEYNYCINEIKLSKEGDSAFLKKVNTKNNSVIPYQLHLDELKKIIDNQSDYYPTLKQNKDKIISILTFRIPYYVGPLNNNPNQKKQFAWMQRNTNDKIYPWNFDSVVNLDASLEKFIIRMTNKCTYLTKEDVLPKNSLLISEFEVLNELNKIRIDGKKIQVKDKNNLFEEVFKNTYSVTHSKIIKWLHSTKRTSAANPKIEGTQQENKFTSSLKSYIDFTKIFGEISDNNYDMIERIIYLITLAPDKKTKTRAIKNEFPDLFEDKEKFDKVCKLNYSGWSRLSKKLLDGISRESRDTTRHTIISVMRKTTKNFMQIINDKKYKFDELIENENYITPVDKITYDMIENLQASPAVKRGIWQSVKVIEEIKNIMGHSPSKICLEFARSDEESRRTKSRYTKIKLLYDSLKKNPDFSEVFNELSLYKENQGELNRKKLFLYFLQNGKCMYSGNKLHINQLSNYEIDHIIPQSYIKDDSIDNIVLVQKLENQYKSDSLLISRDVQNKMRGYWKKLLDCNLISQSKFNKLIRETFSEEELSGFINRQLVETRQIIKHVTTLLQKIYTKTQIVAVKSSLLSDLRKQYGLYKIRELNCYHHAHDALLASVLSNFIETCYPNITEHFNYGEYKKFTRSKENSKKFSFGFIAAKFSSVFVDEYTGEVVWNGEHELNKLRKSLKYHDCFVSRKRDELTGKFYDETIYGHKNTLAKIPKGKNLPVDKYGGFSSEKKAYYSAIEFTEDKNRIKTLVGIPVQAAKMIYNGQLTYDDYFKNQGYKDAVILKKRILMNQLICVNGEYSYIINEGEVKNAKSLIMDEYHTKILYRVLNFNDSKHKTDEISKLYLYLANKMSTEFTIYEDLGLKLKEKSDKFNSLEISEQVKFIKEILKTMQDYAYSSSFKAIGLKDRPDRVKKTSKTPNSKNLKNVEFIDRSVTGMFERRYRL